MRSSCLQSRGMIQEVLPNVYMPQIFGMRLPWYRGSKPCCGFQGEDILLWSCICRWLSPFPTVCLSNTFPSLNLVLTEPLKLVDGHFASSEEPGLGILSIGIACRSSGQTMRIDGHQH